MLPRPLTQCLAYLIDIGFVAVVIGNQAKGSCQLLFALLNKAQVVSDVHGYFV